MEDKMGYTIHLIVVTSSSKGHLSKKIEFIVY